MANEGYWAALPANQIGPEIISRITNYYGDSRVSSILGCQRIAYGCYVTTGRNWTGGTWGGSQGANGGISVSRGGQQGEAVLVHVDHARALAKTVAARITNPKFVWEPQAAEWTSASIRATQTAKDALDHYWHNEGHERLRTLSVEEATFLGEGWTHYEFASELGTKYDVDQNGNPINTGNVTAESILPWNVIRDPWQYPYDLEAPSGTQWLILRVWRNKWDLIAKYPEMEEEIRKAPSIMSGWPSPLMPTSTGAIWTQDKVETLIMYHRKGPAIPGGRTVTALGNGTVLDFHDLEWDKIPVIRRVESDLPGTPYGLPSFWGIVNLQQLYNELQSAVATNQATFAGQLIGIRRGTNLNLMQLGSALSAIECDDEKGVWPIQLTASPPEVFGHMESIVRHMERIMGASKISFGEAEGDRQSGSSQALLSAQLTENSSTFQTSDTTALKMTGSLILNMLSTKATMPIQIGRVGRAQTARGRNMSVSAKDLAGVSSRVFVNLGSPISQTTEGRIKALQVAGTFPQVQQSITPAQFWQVLETGRNEPVVESDVEEGLNIQRENELIVQGKMPPEITVLVTDDHFRHGHEHTITMSDPATRMDPKAVAAFTAHMTKHYCYAYNVPEMAPDPMTGAPVPGPQMDPMYNARMQGLARGVPPAMPPPITSATPPPAEGESTPTQPPGNPDAGSAKMPEQPKNPETGKRFVPPGRPLQ